MEDPQSMQADHVAIPIDSHVNEAPPHTHSWLSRMGRMYFPFLFIGKDDHPGHQYGGRYRKRRNLHGDEKKKGHGHGANEKHKPHSVETRLMPTLDDAYDAYDRYSERARTSGMALNIAIGLQVVLGALVTGLSAVTSGNHTRVMTSILGGISTVVASYLARARGSGEPDTSIGRARDMEKLIRDIEAYILDWGHETPYMAVPGEYAEASGDSGGAEGDGEEPKIPSTRDKELSEHIDQFRRQYDVLEGNANKPRQPGSTGPQNA